MQSGQSTSHNAKENAGAGAYSGEPARWLAVVGHEEFRHCGQAAGPQWLGVKERHDQQGDAATQSEPPGRQAQLKAQLGRAHGGCSAYNRTDNTASYQSHACATSADIIIISGLDAARGDNTRQHRHK